MLGARSGQTRRKREKAALGRRNTRPFPWLLSVMLCLSIIIGPRPLHSGSRDILPLPENPLAGAKVFVEKGCFKCHAVMGFGEAFGRDLTQVGQRMDFYELAGALWSHSPRMIEVMKEKNIPRPGLTPEELRSLFSYIYYLGFLEERGDFGRGEDIFSQKGCGRCHSLGGGAKISLDKYGTYLSPVFIAAALWNHSSTIGRSMQGITFASGEMAHLLAYIRGDALNTNRDLVYLQPGNAAKGLEVFREKKCSVCHGQEGQNLRQSPLRKGLTEIVGMMWNHSTEMWAEIKQRGFAVPRFTVKEMADLMSFLYFIPFDGPKADVAQGEKVIAAKGCLSCHSQGAVKKGMGIDLAGVSGLSVFELLAAMWGHVPQMEKTMKDLNLAWPRFEGREMKDLIFYLKTLK